MMEAQRQQHLRTLRRSLNRAVTALKDDGKVIFHTGSQFVSCWWEPWLEGGAPVPEPRQAEPLLLLPPPDTEGTEAWLARLPEGVRAACEFFWPGPLGVRIKLQAGDESGHFKLTVCCPWHPLAKELLSRSGALLAEPAGPEMAEKLARGEEPEGYRVLLWPEAEPQELLTLLDVSTRPWRLMEQGFVEGDELIPRVAEPVVLSQERAFPTRAIRTYVPEGKTIIVEAADSALLPDAVRALRGQVPPDAWVRVYLDANLAHSHFPDDREVRVYGELTDPERARRRLQAMLERQRRRMGKRVLLIGVAEMGDGCESFRADLQKLGDGWLMVEEGKELQLDLFS